MFQILGNLDICGHCHWSLVSPKVKAFHHQHHTPTALNLLKNLTTTKSTCSFLHSQTILPLSQLNRVLQLTCIKSKWVGEPDYVNCDSSATVHSSDYQANITTLINVNFKTYAITIITSNVSQVQNQSKSGKSF